MIQTIQQSDPCPRCGNRSVHSLYERVGEVERLRKTCMTCQYEWFEKTLNPEIDEEPLLK